MHILLNLVFCLPPFNNFCTSLYVLKYIKYSNTHYYNTSNSFLQRKMLCRKKLVIVLTLTCLVLLYVSANHLLQNEDPENNNNALQNSNTIGSSSSSSNHNAKEDSLQVDNSVRKFEQDSMRNMIYYQSDKNVEFRTSKPNLHKRLCKFMVLHLIY